MIGYIKGRIEHIQDDRVLLENNGIGYQIFTSQMVINQLADVNQEVKIYTYLHVREDELSLFGFLTKEELDTFQLLLTVNGVGPKAALAILSVLTVHDLTCAVMTGDTKTITKANGVGTKGANRIIMELKDKLKAEDVLENGLHQTASATDAAKKENDSISDTVLALVSLGYSESEAVNAVKQVEGASDMNSEALLKLALKKLF